MVLALAMILAIASCSDTIQSTSPNTSGASGEAALTSVSTSTSTTTARSSSTITPSTSAEPETVETTTIEPTVERLGSPRPEWLGTRVLELRPVDNLGVAIPTPIELVDRQLWTVDHLPAPEGAEFVSSLTIPPPADVLERSTWRSECPIAVDELVYGQVSFYGFDGRFHTGEFLLHRDYGDAMVEIFRALHNSRFPIEEMRVTTQGDVDALRTGDSNNTASFVCRNAVSSSNWSRHAFGGAIDINPFHNPFQRGDLVLPELASAYLDRENGRPGMVTAEVVELFTDIGWGWGGEWNSVSDWMHFSDTGN